MRGQLTYDQQRALARLLHELRPDWDVPGIEAHLGRARELAPAPDLACAAIRAATVPSNRTPAVIPLPGAHWRVGGADPAYRPPSRGELCDRCSQPEPTCRRLYAHDHDFRPLGADGADPLTGELPAQVDRSARMAEIRAQVARPTPNPEPVTSTQGAPT